MNGKDLQKARVSLSFSIRQFAELTGINRKMISHLEQTNAQLTQDQEFLLKPYIGVPLTDSTRSRLIRERTHMTQAELGAILERSPRWIANLESGNATPSESIKAVLLTLAGE